MQYKLPKNCSRICRSRVTILGKPIQHSSTAQIFGVVNNRLEAKYVLALGVRLESQLAKVQFEDRQVVRRCLDHHFQSRRFALAVPVGTSFPSEDGLQALYVQPCARPIDQPLEDLLPLSPRMKDQAAAVLDLVHRVLVTESPALLLFQIQRQAETAGVNPALADLAQAPYLGSSFESR